MKPRERLSASVESDLLEAARSAVAEGRAENLSAWVNSALRRQADHDRRMRAAEEFVAAYEAEHGVITDEEIRDVSRRMHARAVVVRGKPEAPGGAQRRRGRALA